MRPYDPGIGTGFDPSRPRGQRQRPDAPVSQCNTVAGEIDAGGARRAAPGWTPPAAGLEVAVATKSSSALLPAMALLSTAGAGALTLFFLGRRRRRRRP